jgi:signal transduction histidine kinase
MEEGMISQRRTDRNVPWVLAAGFALTIVLLMGSGWMSVQAVDAVELHSESLLARHRFSMQLIDEIQGEKASLSSLFYALLAGPRPVDRATLMTRLDTIEQQVGQTLRAAQSELTSERWAGAQAAVERFIAEVRNLVASGADEPPPTLYRAHEALVGAIGQLVSANYETAVQQEGVESSEHRQQLSRALVLLVIALILAVVCAATTVRVAVHMFRRIEWQARELSRLSGHVLETQEQILHRFSRELHDEFGQSLTAIEANLAAVPAISPEVSSRIEDCSLLVKDLMSNVRELSQLLRPSTLDDFGLKPSLQWLAESFTQRTGITVASRLDFDGRVGGEIETHLFRIAQEALTNVTRHSKASHIDLALEERLGVLRLTVADNGGGIQSKPKPGRGGLGLAGMRERMRVSGGQLEVRSDSNGVTVIAEVALNEAAQRAEAYPSPIGG